jgi:hypothetical protein
MKRYRCEEEWRGSPGCERKEEALQHVMGGHVFDEGLLK